MDVNPLLSEFSEWTWLRKRFPRRYRPPVMSLIYAVAVVVIALFGRHLGLSCIHVSVEGTDSGPGLFFGYVGELNHAPYLPFGAAFIWISLFFLDRVGHALEH